MKDLRDLNFTEQFYYDRIIGAINKLNVDEDTQINLIAYVDDLVDEMNRTVNNLTDVIDSLNADLDEARDEIKVLKEN